MSIKATFPAGVTDITVNGLHQWDYGQKLEIQADDLPAVVEVHFAYAGARDAVVRVCEVVDGVTEATIPDQCLEQTSPVLAWIYVIDGAAGATAKTVVLPIIARTQPQPSATVPEEYTDRYTELITAVNAMMGSIQEELENAADTVEARITEDIADGTLVVPKASRAEEADFAGYAASAGNANTATEASHAETATTATTADTAAEATHAASADADGDGNDIPSTYLCKQEAPHRMKRINVGADDPLLVGFENKIRVDSNVFKDGEPVWSVNDIVAVSFSMGDGQIFHGVKTFEAEEDENGPFVKVACSLVMGQSTLDSSHYHNVGTAIVKIYEVNNSFYIVLDEFYGVGLNYVIDTWYVADISNWFSTSNPLNTVYLFFE